MLVIDSKAGDPCSLRIQPPLIRSRYYVRNAKTDVFSFRRLGPMLLSKTGPRCKMHHSRISFSELRVQNILLKKQFVVKRKSFSFMCRGQIQLNCLKRSKNELKNQRRFLTLTRSFTENGLRTQYYLYNKFFIELTCSGSTNISAIRTSR